MDLWLPPAAESWGWALPSRPVGYKSRVWANSSEAGLAFSLLSVHGTGPFFLLPHYFKELFWTTNLMWCKPTKPPFMLFCGVSSWNAKMRRFMVSINQPPAWHGWERQVAHTRINGSPERMLTEPCFAWSSISNRAEAGEIALLPPPAQLRGCHKMSPSFSCRVTAGCTSIHFGRHTDGVVVQTFQKEPCFCRN